MLFTIIKVLRLAWKVNESLEEEMTCDIKNKFERISRNFVD